MTLKVLAIDDSRTMRNMVLRAMEGAGFLCELAEDGVDGVQRFHEVKPDVVITDINMPNMDGFGVIEAIRAGDRNKRVPILVLTTETGPELRARARTAGATGWLTKPFDETALVSTLKHVTGTI